MEKAFKAIIIYAKKIIPRPHGLVELYSEVKNILHVNPSIESNLPGLSAYYTQSRYPNASLRRPSIEIWGKLNEA
ncbi:MAG: HEPN domain-containing protein [Candidatus Methanomethylicia archaeon]